MSQPMRASVAAGRADAHAVPARAARPPADAAGHADLLGGAPTRSAATASRCTASAASGLPEKRRSMECRSRVVRRAAELQVGGIRPERRAVGGRHQHALHHVLHECLRGPARLRRQPGCGPPAEDTRRSGKERNHADGRKDADTGKHDESCGALRKEQIAARDREQHEDEGSHCGKARARRSHRLVPPGPVVLHQYSPPGRI